MTNAVKTFTIKGLWDVCSPYRLTDFQETITATVFYLISPRILPPL